MFFSTHANFCDDILQILDEYTALYIAKQDPLRLRLVHFLLCVLYRRSERERGAGMSEISLSGWNTTPLRVPDGEVEFNASPCSTIRGLQEDSLEGDKHYKAVEKQFIDLCFALYTIDTETKKEGKSSIDTLAQLLTGIPSVGSGNSLSLAICAKKEELQLMDSLGQARESQVASIISNSLQSFRVVTSDMLPNYLYHMLEPLFCELSFSCLLHGPFTNTPLRFIGTNEGMQCARKQLELQRSSLRFLLSDESMMNENIEGERTVARTSMRQRERLQTMLNNVTTMLSEFGEDTFFSHFAEQWRQAIESLETFLRHADVSLCGVSAEKRIEELNRILQFSPQRIAYQLVHCIRLPLLSSMPHTGSDNSELCGETETCVAVLGVSFDGNSIEEVEHLLNPSEEDDITVTLTSDSRELTARLYMHFYDLFVLLLRACDIQMAEVVMMPSLFCDISTSPFIHFVHPSRLANMLRCHFFAFFDVLSEKAASVKVVILLGGSWVQTAKEYFLQWLKEHQCNERFPSIIFKQLSEALLEVKTMEVVGDTYSSPLFSLIQSVIADIRGLKVAVLIPTWSVTMLSRRYGISPLLKPSTLYVDAGEKLKSVKGEMVNGLTNRLLLAGFLEKTVMPLMSYSVCGSTPMPYICDAGSVSAM